MNFKGQYQHTVDAKGRLFIPAKIREGLGDACVASRAVKDPCLYVFSTEGWDWFTDRLGATTDPLASDTEKKLGRITFASATDCEFDSQGRILITAALRQYASIDKEVVIVGMANRVEIWAKEKWEEYSA